MRFNFINKTVVITGGTSGIGLSIAELFGQLGARVAICGTNVEKLNQAVKYLRKKNIVIYGQKCNVGESKELFEFANNVENHFSCSIDIWVSNASVYPQYKIIATPEDVWDRSIDINMKSIYIGGKIAYEKMRQNGGVLINASSFSSIMPSVGSGVYAATKAATNSMIKTLAAELAPYNIRVCGYIPGVIETDMTKPLIESNGENMVKSIAMNDFGKVKDVANAVVFLASEYASYITGTTIEISGGKYSTQNPSYAWE